MDKKSFIRGFGIGVIFTVAILGISCLLRTSDSETISRAKKLGMVFKNEDSKINFSTTASKGAVSADDASAAPKESANPKGSDGTDKNDKADANNTDNTAKTNTDKKEYEDEKKKLQDNADNEKKKLVINDGDWSGKISSELKNMGIIDDADAFDKYLMDNGYSDTINSGIYDVSPDDTFNEIAERITEKYKK